MALVDPKVGKVVVFNDGGLRAMTSKGTRQFVRRRNARAVSVDVIGVRAIKSRRRMLQRLAADNFGSYRDSH